jgi:hypothetical protein
MKMLKGSIIAKHIEGRRKEKIKLLDALNLLDELAEEGGQYGETKEAQAEAYNLLFNFLNKV